LICRVIRVIQLVDLLRKLLHRHQRRLLFTRPSHPGFFITRGVSTLSHLGFYRN
jgi:hypothetical protein